jgi:uncharacterized membrane protein
MLKKIMKSLLFGTLFLSILQQYFYYCQLPYKVAIHFNLDGIPDNFTGKLTSALIQIGIVAFMIGVVMVSDWFLKKGSDDFINIPNRRYWLAPERRDRTIRLLSSFVYWLGIITNIFLIFISQHIIDVNLNPDIVLGQNFWVYLTFYFGALFISIVVFFRILNSRRIDKKISGKNNS